MLWESLDVLLINAYCSFCDTNQIPRAALRWTPPGEREAGRPKITWRRTAIQELQKMNMMWGEARHAAKNRMRWKILNEASCPTGNEQK